MWQRDGRSWCVQGDIRLGNGLDRHLFELLRAIDRTGSINAAAKQVGLSYKSAWTLIERANNKSAKTLVISETGGQKGGGTMLTGSGQILLKLFESLEQKHAELLVELNRAVESDTEALRLLKPLTISTTAANQMFGVVWLIRHGIVGSEAVVKLKGGEYVCANLSRQEAHALELAVGAEVAVLINNTEITLATGPEKLRLSARNQLWGSVGRIELDQVEAEIIVNLKGNGETLSAVMTRASAERMRLKPGLQCRAIFKANAVLLATLAC
ncbi:TOBE domain-containing protein [Methylomonas koyamae]|uniref:TOBE domain-containing protein n=1 Tax=Methylomonas koyamae TaxID=702114 RepID=UPI000BC2FB7E|nr:TOBE domain-containing protein [Methylomonas koyamae]ATG91495.1 molybdenum-dependent transcriptional regulator [Methylomonas koyamae]